MVYREILEKYPREMLEDTPFTKYCFEALIDRLVAKSGGELKGVELRVVAYHADLFGLDYVSLIAEIKII